jgi:phospholipid/cholesterol/gamma-HCH transport system permease protein
MTAPVLQDDRSSSTDAPAGIALERGSAGEMRVVLNGTWKLGKPRPDTRAIDRELETTPATRLVFVARELGPWDTALLSWLRAAANCASSRSIEVDRSGLPSGVVELLDLADRVIEPPGQREEAPLPLVARIGKRATRVGAGALDTLDFLGQVTASIGRFVTFRARYRGVDLVHEMHAAGAQAVPIVTLLSVILGLILAFVGAVQLRLFGADLYVANLVAIATVREMGAMTVGIILAGRTGAAYAAQLGTMKVTEEIDALKTFGIPEIDFLVLPRVVALFLMTPFLCLYAIVLGCLGGAIVGIGMLGLSPQLYFDQSLRSLHLADLYGGLFRGLVYGLLVAVTGCLRGMRSGNDAAAVGEAATSAVVTALVAIIVADGIIAVVFNTLGI